jgi:hypothetical protein
MVNLNNRSVVAQCGDSRLQFAVSSNASFAAFLRDPVQSHPGRNEVELTSMAGAAVHTVLVMTLRTGRAGFP